MVKTLPWFDQYLAHLDLELLHHAFLIGGKEGVGKRQFSSSVITTYSLQRKE